MALVHSEGQDRWYFTKEELQRTPSVLAGIDTAKELSYRQQSANLIQDMGQRLLVSQLTINTAIVYMHRFYMFHSFSDMNRNAIAPCCLFLSAKLEEQPRKLEHVIKVANICLQKNDQLDPQSETYLQQAQDLVINESILLQTLGFELTVDHPHTHVVRITQLVRASKDLAQTSYFMATNSLHLTPFCIQHKPSVVACVCIHLACKWSNWEFPRSSDNKDWWEYVDPTVTKQTLDTICQEFLNIIENCPNRLKRRISTVTIYKGGHRSKSAGEKSSKNSAPANGAAGESKGLSSKADPSSKGEPSGNETLSEADHSQIREPSSAAVATADQLGEQNFESRSNSTTLTITSSAAVVETPTSTVILPQLKPLTTKYASMPGLSSNSENQTKISSSSSKSSTGSKDNIKVVSGTKHKHREHDESSTPAKKLKTTHSSSSHSLHPKHQSSSGRQSFHSKPSKPSSHSALGSHHKIPKSSHPVQSHHNSSPKLPIKSTSSQSHHAHHNSSPKSVRSSSSHGNSSTHLNHIKRHSHPGHSASGHASSHSSGSKTSHKHVSSPLDIKKSSGERHRRPSSSSTKSKQEAPVFGTTLNSRVNDKTKKSQTMDDFASPPGPQRLHKLPPPPRPVNVAEKSASRHGPPLPSSSQGTPPPPPLPSSLPPPPPPPPT